jgi:hypothetical protein
VTNPVRSGADPAIFAAGPVSPGLHRLVKIS